ncbi:ABC transporter permease subunit [Pseudalkalibacillus hwajinpoensis]|uniref:ABC transporter permease subunit n=1 Tax=Guptibacillus hwajinpoensis TaxID=208199 RepID=A0A4U1MP51_9BACL|nr:ABC transporter permease subunit [Pseudalkalibacillus hwajinpoensis]TKD72290.1 ABC transporter permease subunit [Pseudalkalibacillus hwajinpoensis]
MAKNVLYQLIKFFLVIIGIIIVSSFLGMFINGFAFGWGSFQSNLVLTTKSLLNPKEMIAETIYEQTEFRVFPTFWNYYNYSITILLAAFFVTVFSGIGLSYISYILPKKITRPFANSLSFLEALPDIFVIFVVQYITILIYKHTDILLFSVAGSYERVYLLPIIILAFLPSLFFWKVSVLMVHQELEKPYVTLAIGKGMGKTVIFGYHIMRNAAFGLMNHIKPIIWILLSNLIILERLFNVYGISHFILEFPSPQTLALSLIMIYIPFFVILTVSQISISKLFGKEEIGT